MLTKILTAAFLLIFFAVMITIGVYCRKHATNVSGFVLGGRRVGPWLSAFAFGTSYFSAVIFVGYAGQFGWTFGLASTWIGLGNAFIGSLLAWTVLGRRTRIMTQALGSNTMPDFFGKRFDSGTLRWTSALIVFIFLIPYTASLYNGLSSLFGIAFSIPYWVVILVMAALTCAYVLFGGYMATAINDFIQGIIMLIGIVVVIAAVLNSQGGYAEAVAKLSEQFALTSGGSTFNGAYTSFLGPDPIFLFFVVMLTSLGTWGLPQMVGKFYAIKDEASIRKGTIISTLFAVVVAGGCYFLGGFGRLFFTPAELGGKFDQIVPTMLSGLAPIVIAIVIVLVLSASMSTLSSLVLTSSSTLTLDLVYRKKEGEVPEKKKLIVLRLFTVFFIVLSAVIAILKDSVWSDNVFIAQMMGVSWGALAGAFLAPFLYGLYWKKTTKPAVAVCFVYGTSMEVFQLVVTMIQKTSGTNILAGIPFLDFVFRNSLYSGVFAMVGGLILVPVISLLTQKKRPAGVDEMFGCYKKTVTTEVTDSLGETK